MEKLDKSDSCISLHGGNTPNAKIFECPVHGKITNVIGFGGGLICSECVGDFLVTYFPKIKDTGERTEGFEIVKNKE